MFAYTRRGGKYELLEDWFFNLDGRKFKVHAGFKWNGSTIGPTRKWNLEATCAHDFLYRTQPAGITRADADRVFFRLLRRDNAPQWYICAARAAANSGLFWLAWQFKIG